MPDRSRSAERAPTAVRRTESGGVRRTEASAVARWQQALAEATRAPRWVLWLPVLLVVVDLGLEYALPESVAAGFLCTVLPVVVAFGLGPGLVAASTLVAVGLQMMLAERAGHLAEQHHIWVYVTTVLAGVLGAALSWQRRRQARDLVRVRTIADTLQHAVLRPVPAAPGRLRAAGLYRPAQADVAVGGDLYEVCETRFGTRVLLGDVRGKGLDAVRTVADVIGAFRVTAHETADLTELAGQLDRQVLREAADRADEELFVTAVLLQHCPRTGRVELVNRGHLAPLLLSPGAAEPVDCPDRLPLGFGHLAADGERPTTVELARGCTLLLHTDGVSEARDRAGVFYPLAERLARLGTTDPRAVVAFLDRDVRGHCERLTDDLAVLALTPA
ncbi:PP2C family protein-serine/threonine phosphatase [Kitasatospora sp. NPDC048540]|uniref:PP2C family protein-serine/threonine phosphatase n=1 Tax=Kitasatospora sp. NPDC048540 TaxID=3155634 RepID=UPI0033EB79E6